MGRLLQAQAEPSVAAGQSDSVDSQRAIASAVTAGAAIPTAVSTNHAVEDALIARLRTLYDDLKTEPVSERLLTLATRLS